MQTKNHERKLETKTKQRIRSNQRQIEFWQTTLRFMICVVYWFLFFATFWFLAFAIYSFFNLRCSGLWALWCRGLLVYGFCTSLIYGTCGLNTHCVPDPSMSFHKAATYSDPCHLMPLISKWHATYSCSAVVDHCFVVFSVQWHPKLWAADVPQTRPSPRTRRRTEKH